MVDRYARSHTDPADTEDHRAAIRDDWAYFATLTPEKREECECLYPQQLMRMAEMYRDPVGAYRVLRDYAEEVRGEGHG